MGIISDTFNAKISALRNTFEVNKDINHPGIKGSFNEEGLSNLIKEVIPTKYKISKGIIENALGEQSKETDIFIYDDEILPAYIKNTQAFVPVEAVKYNIEVKSTLNSQELKTTIEKFTRFKLIDGCAPTVLFSFSSDIAGSELHRYYKNDDHFLHNPKISVLCVSNKSYYYKSTTEHYIKDHLSKNELIKQNIMPHIEDANNPIELHNLCADSDDKKLTVNGIDYEGIKFKVHKWIGVESNDNIVELSFLSGISNTLSISSFGNYLLNKNKPEFKTFAICYEDMWGNLSCQDFNADGLNYNPDKVSFNFESSTESNKVSFKIKE